jgi:hypothetical protein
MNDGPALRRAAVTLLLSLATFASGPAGAQLPIPLGNQELVNQSTELDQDESDVAITPDGAIAVVWRDAMQDGDQSAIMARLRPFFGAPTGSEFQINTTATGDQRNPRVAAADDGRFVVVWESRTGALPGFTDLFGSLREADGQPVAGAAEFPINTTTFGMQQSADVAMLPGGGFMVLWEDRSLILSRIVGRVFPADYPNSPPTAEIPLNLLVLGTDQERPAIVADPATGGFYVAWQGLQILPLAASSRGLELLPSIFLRRLNSGGTGPVELVLNLLQSLEPRGHVALAANASGRAIAAWEGQDGTHRGIYARTIDNGVPSPGGEVQINLFDDLDEREPSVVADENGDFVATWVRASPALESVTESPLGSPIVIKGRRGHGNAALAFGGGPSPDDEFVVNSSGADFREPRVALAPQGDFAIAWAGTDDGDPQGLGVFLRRFAVPLFADGFESEDLKRWSEIGPP